MGLWASSPALAGGYYLESAAVQDKDLATAMVGAASGQGLTARVVRRYRPGAGWQYVMLVEGFTDQGAAASAAQSLAAGTGTTIGLFEAEGGQARRIGESVHSSVGEQTHAAAAEAPPEGLVASTVAVPVVAPVEPQVALPDASARRATAEVAGILSRAVRAHGGVTGGLSALQAADAVLFRYRRTLPDGSVVRHSYARRGADVFLDVVIEEGPGASSRSGISGEMAWLSLGDSAAVPQDLERTREVLDRFAPERVLSFALGFAQAVEDRRELQNLTLVGQSDLGGETCHILRYGGDQASGPLAIAVDVDRSTIRRVTFASDAGDLTLEYTDYGTEAGFVAPHRVRTWRGETLVDDVEVLEMSLAPRLQEAWFPTGGT
jgi:hypothetical protein